MSAAAVPAAMSGVKSAFNAVPKWVWWVLALIILYFVLRNPVRRAWQRFTAEDRGDYTGQGLSPTDEARLRTLAAQLRSVIEGFGIYDREAVMAQAVALSDTQLQFLVDEYEANSDTSLIDDVDDEIMPGSDIDEQLMARLRAIGRL